MTVKKTSSSRRARPAATIEAPSASPAAVAGAQPWARDLAAKLLALLALGVAYKGTLIIAASPWIALGYFTVSGVLLYLASPKALRGSVGGFLREPQPMQAWEPWFALFLLVGGSAWFLWRYSTMPPGAIYSEGLLVGQAAELSIRTDYVAHHFGTINWPTLYDYQGLLMVKFFGFHPSSFRYVSFFYAMVLLFGVWLTSRALTSPGVAALVALLWLGFHYDFHFARRYSPVLMSALPAVFVLGLGLGAVRRRSWLLALGAGAAAGLGLHAYFPGRIAPVMLLMFMVPLWLQRGSLQLRKRVFAAALAGVIIAGGPILLFALRNPMKYNFYITTNLATRVSAASGWQKIKEAAPTIIDQIRPYALMFHVEGAHTSDGQEDDMIRAPVLDPVMKVIAPIGLVLALLALRGAGSFVFLGFIFGFLPAILILQGAPPWPRRAIFAFPFMYLGAALVLEHLRLTWTRGRFRVPNWLYLLLGFAMAGWLGQRMMKHYEDYALGVGMGQFANAAGGHAREEIDAHPGAALMCSWGLIQVPSSIMLFPPDRPMRSANCLAEHFELDPGKDNLILMEGWHAANLPVLKALYPHSVEKIFREPRLATDQGVKDNDEVLYLEHCYLGVGLVTLFVPKQDAADAAGLLQAKGGKEESVHAFTPQGLELMGAGPQRLAASAWLDTAGSTLTVHVGLPGWRARLAGRPIPLDKPFRAPGGMQVLELEGVVPKGAHGAFPLTMNTPVADLLQQRRLFAHRFKPTYSADVFHIDPAGHVATTKTYTWRGIAPVIRFNDTGTWTCTYHLVVNMHVRPKVSGDYEFRMHWPGAAPAKVWLDGKLANDRWQVVNTDPMGALTPIHLTAGKQMALKAIYYDRCVTDQNQGFSFEMRAPGQSEWTDLPWDWVED